MKTSLGWKDVLLKSQEIMQLAQRIHLIISVTLILYQPQGLLLNKLVERDTLERNYQDFFFFGGMLSAYVDFSRIAVYFNSLTCNLTTAEI